MLEYTLAILLTIIFIFLWLFVKKAPKLFADIFHQLRNIDHGFNMAYVFSAETAAGKEVEFIDDKPLETQKGLIVLRIILVVSYFLIMAYLFIR